MSRDYAEKEREFIEGLKADTGRDLGEWMSAIGDKNFAHRNDAIDWLRQQGFLFAWASWLERIHNNGGQPIYYDESAPPAPAAPVKHPAPPPASPPPSPPLHSNAGSHDGRPVDVPTPRPVQLEGASVIQFPGARSTLAKPPPPAPSRAVPASSPSVATSPQVMAVIAAAKAYAPLAGFLIRSIADNLPGTVFRAGTRRVEMFAGPLPFALLSVGGKDLKLVYAGPADRFEPPSEKSRLPNLGVPLSPLLTHMVALTDARQIDEAFVETIRRARARVER